MQPARIFAVLLAAFAAWPAHAQTVWRCADGYSQQPCPGGTPLATSAAPSPADRAQASAAAARDQRLADGLERQRLQREAQAQAAPQATVLPGPAATDLEPARTPEQKATRKLDVFTASVPGSAKPKAKDKKDKPAKKKPAGAAVGGDASPKDGRAAKTG